MGIMDCRILNTDHGLCDSLQMRYIWKKAEKRATRKKVGMMVIGEESTILFFQH